MPNRVNWVFVNGTLAQQPIGFALARDMGGEYTFASTDQRGRATLNGIWDIGYGLQLSGIYFYGNGERRSTDTGDDNRSEGNQSEERLNLDGTIVDRNNFVGLPIHRVDMRLQQRIPLGGSVGVDAMFEVFNLLNHDNFGSYETETTNANFGAPEVNTNIAYLPGSSSWGSVSRSKSCARPPHWEGAVRFSLQRPRRVPSPWTPPAQSRRRHQAGPQTASETRHCRRSRP